MNMQALTISLEKAPSGGYFMRMGSEPERIDAARSSLAELMELVHVRATERFGESCWRPQPMMPASHILPPAPPPAHSPEHEPLPEGMPRVVESYAANGGMMGELYGRANGVLRAMVPALFIGALWFGMNARFVV